jgi:hypothetical protein
MECTSESELRSWVHNHCFDTTQAYIKTEVDKSLSTSVLFQEHLCFFLLDYSYQSSINKETAGRYFSFLYNLWKAVVLFGYSYVYPMEHKATKLSLMNADYHLATTAEVFGTIEHHEEMGNLLDKTMLAITMNLKDQPIAIRKEKSFDMSKAAWKNFQKKRYLPILLFFLDALVMFYDLQEYNMERVLLYVQDLAVQSDPVYGIVQPNDFYYNELLKTTKWKVLYVNNEITGSPFYLPITSGQIERRDCALSTK